VQRLLLLLGAPEFATLAAQLGGYDTTISGRMVTHQELHT
jgi:hypothetical protein